MQNNSEHIHPTAIISDTAKLGKNVQVGPYSVVGPEVSIGDQTQIGSHCVIHPYTRIGSRNRIHSHVILGDTPQHLAFKEETISWLEIGDENEIREMFTAHRGLEADSVTRIGSNTLLMVNSHVGHDCSIGDHVILTNNSAIGGHVEIGEHAIVGGQVGVHQFVRVGAYSMLAASSFVRKDILPYTVAGGAESARHYRLNSIGLKRKGITGERYRLLEQAYRSIRSGNRQLDVTDTDETRLLQQWLAAPSQRGLAGFQRADLPPKS